MMSLIFALAKYRRGGFGDLRLIIAAKRVLSPPVPSLQSRFTHMISGGLNLLCRRVCRADRPAVAHT
jgi:hypothetical protein